MSAVCSQCSKSTANTTTLTYSGKTIHNSCFFCTKCKTNLQNKQFSEKDTKLYCLPCITEKCAGCSQAVKEGGIMALNKAWHAGCFVCHRCKGEFKRSGGKFIVGEGEKPLCLSCGAISSPKVNQKLFKCKKCKQNIGEGATRIIALNQNFHSECFLCYSCNSPLNPQRFCSANSKPHCADCALQKKAVKCCQCNKLITSTIIFALKKNWHPECLCCHYCNVILTNYGKVYRRGKYPCCPACVESVFSSSKPSKPSKPNNNNNNNNNKINPNSNNNNGNNHGASGNQTAKNNRALITTLDKLLEDEIAINYFIKFLVKEYAVENILFYLDVNQFRQLQNPHDIKIYSKSIYSKYIQRDAELEINIDADVSHGITNAMNNPTTTMFDVAYTCVLVLMRDHSFNNFILSSSEYQELCSL